MSQSKKIIIVGAGPGGLTSAMILASRGFEVHLYEKNEVVGGRNAPIRAGDFTFDTGPTFLMMKFILDQMFHEVNRESSDYLSFTHLDPMYRLLFRDFAMDIHNDPARMKAEIARHFPGEESSLDAFYKTEASRFRHIFGCLQKDYGSPLAFLSPTFLKAIPYIPFGRTIFDYLGTYFASEKLRLSFTFQAKYLGMSPWECPAFFIILPYIEHQFGVYHVEGGLNQISLAMAKVFEEHGGHLHLSQPVSQLVIKDRSVKGVQFADGTVDLADEVVLNADFGYAMTNLVPPGVLKTYKPEAMQRKKYSCSTFMIYLGLDKLYTELPHHTIAFADDYRGNIHDIFQDHKPSEGMSFYIQNASITDPTLAPEGKSTIYILVPAPNMDGDTDWPAFQKEYRAKIFKAIAERTPIQDLESHIIEERVITPNGWEQRNNFKGATFNLAHTFDQMLYFRPHNRFEELDHCYLVGGGTHPGSGLPTIYESGRITANLISDIHGVPFEPPKAFDGAVMA